MFDDFPPCNPARHGIALRLWQHLARHAPTLDWFTINTSPHFGGKPMRRTISIVFRGTCPSSMYEFEDHAVVYFDAEQGRYV
jgi:hypothetical protein